MSHHYKHGRRFVVRSDVGVQRVWLGRATNSRNLLHAFAPDERRNFAHEFTCPLKAQHVADRWSDVPGVWRVVVRPAVVHAKD